MLLAGWRVTLGQGILLFPAWSCESLPGDLVTTSSLEMGMCRQACPVHIPLQVIAGRVMPMG